MNEFLPQSSKAEIMKGIMRHPESSKLIKEAFASPLGSTSRAKARKTLSIMSKLQYSHDGAGGPGMMAERYNIPEQNLIPPTNNPKGIVIFHKIPVPKIKYYSGSRAPKIKPRAVSHDGYGGPGPGIYDGAGGLFGDIKDTIGGAATSTMNYFATPFTSPSNRTANSTTAYIAPKVRPAPVPAPAPTPALGSINYYPGIKDLTLSDYGSGISTLWSGIKKAVTPVGKGIYNYAVKPVIGTLGAAATGLGDIVLGGVGALDYGARTAYNTVMGGSPTLTPKASDIPAWNSMVSPADVGAWGLSSYLNLGSKPLATTPTTTSTTPTTTPPSGRGNTLSNGWPVFSGRGSTETSSVSTPSSGSPITSTTQGGTSTGYTGGTSIGNSGGWTSGYGSEIVPNLADRQINSLTPEEQTALYNAQMKREGSEIPNNPFGIKQGVATQKWVDQGLAIVGNAAADGGKFLNFKDPAVAQAAYKDLLYNSGVYSNLSIEDAMRKWSGSVREGDVSGGTTPGSLSPAQAAVSSKQSSPTTFAYEQMGGTLEEEAAANKARIWGAYNLDTDKASIKKLQAEVTALPKDMTDYISARDSYIKQTDKAIDDYMEETKGWNTADPVVAQRVASHLNYLYTLRGRQNQSYMGYLNDAVIQHETKLNNAITSYNDRLAIAQSELTSANEISKAQYTMKFNSLTELYQAVKNAPIEALQTQALWNQVYGAAATGATDQVAYDAKMGYIPQSAKLADAQFVDKNRYARLGTNLVDEINSYSVTDPSILSSNIIRAYAQGVQSYLNAADEKDGVTGTGVTSSGKKQLAEEAIRNFAQLAAVGMQSGNDATVNQGVQSAMQIGQSLSSQIASNIKSVSAGVMEAVRTLAPGGSWYTLGMTRSASPTLGQFISTVKYKTNDSPFADSIAKAIYATFLRYSQESGSSPSGAVQALLNNVTSTTGRVPYTPDEFASVIGRLYAEDVLMSEFSINQDVALTMQNQLYQPQ